MAGLSAFRDTAACDVLQTSSAAILGASPANAPAADKGTHIATMTAVNSAMVTGFIYVIFAILPTDVNRNFLIGNHRGHAGSTARSSARGYHTPDFHTALSATHRETSASDRGLPP